MQRGYKMQSRGSGVNWGKRHLGGFPNWLLLNGLSKNALLKNFLHTNLNSVEEMPVPIELAGAIPI